MNKNIISLISLIIAIILIFVFVVPSWNALGIIKNELSQKQIELKQLKQRLNVIDKLKTKYQKSESEIQKVFLALPKQEDIPNLIVQFEALAEMQGLILDSISFGQVDKGDTQSKTKATGVVQNEDGVIKTSSSLRSLNVDMGLSGSYANFKSYLNALANNIRSMNVESISFNANSFNLAVIVYYQ